MTKKEEVFSGVSAPNKYEFLLTWDTETLPESRELVLEKGVLSSKATTQSV